MFHENLYGGIDYNESILGTIIYWTLREESGTWIIHSFDSTIDEVLIFIYFIFNLNELKLKYLIGFNCSHSKF